MVMQSLRRIENFLVMLVDGQFTSFRLQDINGPSRTTHIIVWIVFDYCKLHDLARL